MSGLKVLSAGPSRTPDEVLEAVAQRLKRSPDSVTLLETTDRSESGRQQLEEATSLARSLLKVPGDFELFFLPGGACQLFAMAALNLRGRVNASNFVETDYWTARAHSEFAAYLPTQRSFTGEPYRYRKLPEQLVWTAAPTEAIFFTTNNTASGTEWRTLPRVTGGIRIFDMSSDLFARRPEYEAADLVIACAQKHFGVAGLSLLLIRRETLAQLDGTRGVFSFQSWQESKGLYNTLPMVPLIITLEWLRYLDGLGGPEKVRAKCEECSRIVYDYLDVSTAFTAHAIPAVRSAHNVTFHWKEQPGERTDELLRSAASEGFVGLKGHPSIGGFRASFYAGASPEDASALVSLLRGFESGTLPL